MKISASDERPDEVVVEMESHEEFEQTKSDGPERARYLFSLYESMIGRLMPIRIKILIPIPRSIMLKEAKEVAEKLEVENGKLVIFGVVSHPEMNGYPLDKEMLPALATAGDAREIARRLT